jgi:hypothetical protein
MIRKTKEQTGQIIDTGKKVYDKGKDIYEKGKEVTEDVGRAVGGDGKKPR